MKVVHLNTSDFGGAAIAAVQLHQALLDKGVESDLLTLVKTRNDIPRHHLVEPFELKGDPLVNKLKYKAGRLLEVAGVVDDRHNAPDNKNLNNRPAGREIFTVPYSHFSILDHPLLRQADVIHLHWVSFGMIDHGEFFRNCGKRIVWTMHDMNPFTGGCHHADECNGYQQECGFCPQLVDHGKAFQYWTYKQAAIGTVANGRLRLVAPSQWLADLAKSSSIMQGRSCTVIPNGFDTEHFKLRDKRTAREKLGLSLDKKLILFNAMDLSNTRKGMGLLIAAMQELERSDIQLVSLGGHSAAKPAGLDIHDAGSFTSVETIALYYAAADLFVLPSMAENLPNTISESLLCGTPVVAFRTGGIPEQVDSNNGILVDKKLAEPLSAAIDNALKMIWDHKAIASHAAERYDRKRIAGEYMQLYQQ